MALWLFSKSTRVRNSNNVRPLPHPIKKNLFCCDQELARTGVSNAWVSMPQHNPWYLIKSVKKHWIWLTWNRIKNLFLQRIKLFVIIRMNITEILWSHFAAGYQFDRWNHIRRVQCQSSIPGVSTESTETTNINRNLIHFKIFHGSTRQYIYMKKTL